MPITYLRARAKHPEINGEYGSLDPFCTTEHSLSKIPAATETETTSLGKIFFATLQWPIRTH